MTKRAILCMGAESTGTRFMVRVFNSLGYVGKESGNYFDQYLPIDEQKLVWHRTFPIDGYGRHVHRWVPVSRMAEPLKAAGFDTRAIVMHRDWHSVISSQLRVNHSKDRNDAWQKLQRAYPAMFRGLEEHQIPFVVVSYEAMTSIGKPYIDEVLQMLDIEPPDVLEDIKDGNVQYYQND